MKIAIVLCVAVGSFLAGTWFVRKSGGPRIDAGNRHILYYHDPMHPAYKSDKPGIALDCGMQLEPVYADGAPGLQDPPDPKPAGTVQVTPEKQQVIGVKVEEVARGAGSHTFRVLGRVTLDETRVFRVAAAVDGWIRDAGPLVTGNMVRKDDVLATFYNRDFLTAQQTYLYSLSTMDRFKDNESTEQLNLTKAQMRAAEENLEFLGMSETQLHQIAHTRQIARNIEVRSPIMGLVLARNAFSGLRYDRGTELYRIADISHVWILADIFENEAQHFKPGTAARINLPRQQKTLKATVSEVLPQFDPNTRTLKVRLDADNPGFILRPDMFVDVELPVRLPAALTVPADAVLDSGLKKTIFVERGNGYFEPREVETGWRFGDRVEIVKGLSPGERIVVSGNFLIDSESRMKLAAAGMQSVVATANRANKDPVCGMRIDASEASAEGHSSDYRGQPYYFCSDHCKQQFDKNPATYLANTVVAERQHD